MGQTKVFAAWAVGFLLLGACSSAPPAPDGVQERKNRAADYLKFGRQAFQAAQYDQALTFYQNALDLDTAVDFEPGMAAAWNSVATAQTALGEMDGARVSLAQAEDLAAESGDRVLVLQVAVNLVQADLAAGRTDRAQTRLDALAPFPETAEGAALDHALGNLERTLGHQDLAFAAFDRALVLNQRLGLKQEMASNHFMKAMVFGHGGKWTEALAELQAALDLDRVMENTMGIGQDWRAIGTVDLQLPDTTAAFEAYGRAARLFQSAGLGTQQKKTIEMLLPVAEALGFTEERDRYQAILDRLAPPVK